VSEGVRETANSLVERLTSRKFKELGLTAEQIKVIFEFDSLMHVEKALTGEKYST
jgi:hypothetical protein